MAVSLDDINRVTLRNVFLPWAKRQMADLGIQLPADWNPSDEELERFAQGFADAFREDDIAGDEDGF